jgi:hypothetical protein
MEKSHVPGRLKSLIRRCEYLNRNTFPQMTILSKSVNYELKYTNNFNKPDVSYYLKSNGIPEVFFYPPKYLNILILDSVRCCEM